MPELVIIVVYISSILAVGIFSARSAKGISGFFVAGRSGSTLLITGSLIATAVGGSATVGMAGLGFARGLTGAWWLLVGSGGLIILGILFARKIRAVGPYTLPELITKQYNRKVGLTAALLIIIAWIGIIAGQIVAAGKILSVLGMGSASSWMIISALVFIAYTVLAGQYSIIRTDTIQVVIILSGILVGTATVLSRTGGITGLRTYLPEGYFTFPLSTQFDLKQLFSLLIMVGSTYVVGPDIYSRLFCARNERAAKASTFWAALLIIPLAFCITIIGMGAKALYPDILPEQALPIVMKAVMPPILNGAILAALLCAVMSSADTCLLSASTIFSMDVIGYFVPSRSEAKIVSLSRWGIVILGVFSLILALLLKGIINALLFAYTVYTCGLVLPVIFGFYREKLKVTSWGAQAAIAGGGITALVGKLLGIEYLNLVGFAISGVLLFLVSSFTRKGGIKHPF